MSFTDLLKPRRNTKLGEMVRVTSHDGAHHHNYEITWQYSQNNSNHGEPDAGDEEERSTVVLLLMMKMMVTMALIRLISSNISKHTWQYSQNNSNHAESDAAMRKIEVL